MSLYKGKYPAVSIILPTFNRGYIISRAVKSVLNQTWQDWELLIIDDGSTDDTSSVLEKLLTDDRIHYYKHEHTGLPFSLNRGIDLSKGEFITFLGSDDYYLPEHLECRIKSIKDNNADFLHGGVKIIGSHLIPDKNDVSKLIDLNECVIGGTFFCKREIFEREGGFKNIEYSEDSEFFERIIGKYKILKVDFPTYVYCREDDNSISMQIKNNIPPE